MKDLLPLIPSDLPGPQTPDSGGSGPEEYTELGMFPLHSVPLGRLVVLLVVVDDSWRLSSERSRSPFVAEIAPVTVRVRESINEVLGEKLAELFE